MRTISKILSRLNRLRVHFLVKYQPQTWSQATAWVWLYEHTDLSYIVNYFEQYLPYGLIWRNTLFRDRLVKEYYKR